MSSILKAIRKAEDEKRASDSVAPDLMVDHGQSSAVKRPPLTLPLLAGVVLGAMVVVAGITMLDLDGDSATDSKTVRQNGLENASPGAAERPKPLIPKTVVSERYAEKSVAPEAGRSEEIIMHEAVASEPVKGGTVDNSAKKTVKASDPRSQKVAEKTAATSIEPVKKLPTPAGVDLVVSEIFYHQDEANRMAVVNDLPVMLGTYVDSAIVSAINQDSVEFEAAGKSYRVSVSAR